MHTQNEETERKVKIKNAKVLKNRRQTMREEGKKKSMEKG